MTGPYLLMTGGHWAAVAVLVAVVAGIVLLLRNRARCPHDNHALELAAPGKRKHMVLRCPKCGYTRKTQAYVGRRRS